MTNYGDKETKTIKKLTLVPIDRNIPIPPLVPVSPKNYKKYYAYPWKLMEIGDSFLFPTEVRYNTIRSLCGKVKYRHGIKVSIRRTIEGHRVWRIK